MFLQGTERFSWDAIGLKKGSGLSAGKVLQGKEIVEHSWTSSIPIEAHGPKRRKRWAISISEKAFCAIRAAGSYRQGERTRNP